MVTWKNIKNTVYWGIISSFILTTSYQITKTIQNEINSTHSNITELNEQATAHIGQSINAGESRNLSSAYEEISIAIQAYNLMLEEIDSLPFLNTAKNRKLKNEIILEIAKLTAQQEIIRYNLNNPNTKEIIKIPETIITEEPKLERKIIEEEPETPKKERFLKRIFKRKKN